MGCDIHVVLERNIDGAWHLWDRYDTVGYPAYLIPSPAHPAIEVRNYAFFAALAGVRGAGPRAKGLPKDISAGAKKIFNAWGEDGHTPSWALAKEFLSLYCQHSGKEEECVRFVAGNWTYALQFLGQSTHETLDEFRFVFCFDN